MPGANSIEETRFGQRALAGARTGTDRIANPNGTHSSVQSATFDIPNADGTTDVILAPTILKFLVRDPLTGKTTGTKMLQLTGDQAFRMAMKRKDFVTILKGAKTMDEIKAARARGEVMSRQFSDELGRISVGAQGAR